MMILGKAFEQFVKDTSVCVMIRGCLEYALSEKFVNEIFETTACRQYTRDLLFSDVVDVMGSVVCQVFPSVRAAYQKQADRFSVSRRALCDKINLVEPRVTRQLVKQTTAQMQPVVRHLRRKAGAHKNNLLPGYTVRILDGNHLAASERRIRELRDIAAGPLPGKTVVVFDPDLRLVVDAFPCEDGHAQERSLLTDVLDAMEPGEVWIGDRNFCTTQFLFQTAANQAYFIIRQHATNVRWTPAGEQRKVGRTETGMVYQQRVKLLDQWGSELVVRRITVKLDKPTEEGDTEIHLFTNLPNRVKATRIADAYRGRWRIERAFGELATALHCEIPSLGYPPAALFAFGMGLIAYNILSVVRTSLATVHGEEWVENLSAYYLSDEIRGMMRGMMTAIPVPRWQRTFGGLTPRQMTTLLIELAGHVNIERFRKTTRSPKKPRTERTRYKRTPHVSTARILEKSRGRKIRSLS
jgi:hypothetical protein